MKFKVKDLATIFEKRFDCDINGLRLEFIKAIDFCDDISYEHQMIVRKDGHSYFVKVLEDELTYTTFFNDEYEDGGNDDLEVECPEVVAQARIEYITDYVLIEEDKG